MESASSQGSEPMRTAASLGDGAAYLCAVVLLLWPLPLVGIRPRLWSLCGRLLLLLLRCLAAALG